MCHGGADKAWVRDLGARLEAERIGNRHIEVWLDEWDVDHGENIVEKIDEGLKIARFCAVVISGGVQLARNSVPILSRP